jgi:hypothetical protein
LFPIRTRDFDHAETVALFRSQAIGALTDAMPIDQAASAPIIVRAR